MVQRILVDPDLLRRSARDVARVADELRDMARRSDTVVIGLVWEARAKQRIGEESERLRKQATTLVTMTEKLEQTLVSAAERFETTDRSCADGLNTVNADVQRVWDQFLQTFGGFWGLPRDEVGRQLGSGHWAEAVPEGAEEDRGWFDSIGTSIFDWQPGQGAGGTVESIINVNVHEDDVRHQTDHFLDADPLGIDVNGTRYQSEWGHSISTGVGFGDDGSPVFGISGAAYQERDENLFVVGGRTLGGTMQLGEDINRVEGQLGYADGSVGAGLGYTAWSQDAEVGVNVAGVNAAATGSIGIKAELGVSIGKETEVRLPFISVGLSFGGAK